MPFTSVYMSIELGCCGTSRLAWTLASNVLPVAFEESGLTHRPIILGLVMQDEAEVAARATAVGQELAGRLDELTDDVHAVIVDAHPRPP